MLELNQVICYSCTVIDFYYWSQIMSNAFILVSYFKIQLKRFYLKDKKLSNLIKK